MIFAKNVIRNKNKDTWSRSKNNFKI
jgi:hypothetical protein